LHPPSNKLFEPLLSVVVTPTVTAIRQFLNFRFHLSNAFRVDVQISYSPVDSKRIPQKLHPSDIRDTCFLTIHPEKQLVLNVRRDILQCPFSGAFALAENQHIVRITDELMTSALQFVVEFVQQYVRK